MPLQLKIWHKIKVELQLLFDLMLKAETNNKKSTMTLMHIQTLKNLFGATNQAIFQIIAWINDILTLQKNVTVKRNKFLKKISTRVLSLQKEIWEKKWHALSNDFCLPQISQTTLIDINISDSMYYS